MFKLFFRKKEKNCINTRTIFYEDLKTFPKELLFKAKIGRDIYGFDIIAFRRMYQLALENEKKMTNPHDPYNRTISKKIIKRAKKFWKSGIKKHCKLFTKKIIEYRYSVTNLKWPKPNIPLCPLFKLAWNIHESYPSLASFNICYNDKPIHRGYYYIPRFMKIGNSMGEKYTIDTASTTSVGIYHINELWNKQKLVKKPFTYYNKLNIIEMFEQLLYPKYWKLNEENLYTADTFRLWIDFVENLKNQ